MSNTLAIVSLLFFAAAIALGYFRNLNMGLIGISFAMIFGVYICKIAAKTVVGYWPIDLCMTFMGMSFLFSIADKNGSLQVVADSMTKMLRGKVKLFPFFFFFLPVVLNFCGVSCPSTLAIVGPIFMSVAHENKMEDLDVTICAVAGSLAGAFSKVHPTGAVAYNLGLEAWTASGFPAETFNYGKVIFGLFAFFTVEFLLVYFIRGMFRYQDCEVSQQRVTINGEQKTTMVVIAIALLAILIFGTHTGLTAFLAGTFLLLLGIGKQKEAIAGISWNTVILVGGMTLLIKVVGTAGGISMISDALSSIMTKNTAASLLNCVAALMSCVSSATGVVMPSLLPTIPDMLANISGVGFYPMFIGIVLGANVVTFSPLSTLGALMLSVSEENKKGKLFTQQLIFAILSTLFAALVLFLASGTGLI